MVEEINFEAPKEFNSKTVVFWEPTSKELKVAGEKGLFKANPLLTKAKKFLDESCIRKINNTTFLCTPLKDYNKTSYTISSTSEGFFCNCQGFNKKLQEHTEGKSEIKPICSHVLAVKQYCFIESRGKQ